MASTTATATAAPDTATGRRNSRPTGTLTTTTRTWAAAWTSSPTRTLTVRATCRDTSRATALASRSIQARRRGWHHASLSRFQRPSAGGALRLNQQHSIFVVLAEFKTDVIALNDILGRN